MKDVQIEYSRTKTGVVVVVLLIDGKRVFEDHGEFDRNRWDVSEYFDPENPKQFLPEMIPVTSSNIKSIGYDIEESELFVSFNGGPSVYRYTDVPIKVFNKFLEHESKGAFFARQVKDCFEFEKLVFEE